MRAGSLSMVLKYSKAEKPARALLHRRARTSNYACTVGNGRGKKILSNIHSWTTTWNGDGSS